MSKKCVVNGCSSEISTGYSIPFDKPTIAAKWIAFLKQHNSLKNNLGKTDQFCPVHFSEQDFLRKRGKVTKKLSKKAIPSIYQPEENNSRTQNTTDIKIEVDKDEDEPVVSISSQPAKVSNGSGTSGKPVSDSDTEEESDDDSDDDESQDVSYCFFAKRKESPLIFMDIPTDEDIDSDFEPVGEDESFETVRLKYENKTQLLRQEERNLKEMQDMIASQSAVIARLKCEFDELKKFDEKTKPESDSIEDDPSEPLESKIPEESLEEEFQKVIESTEEVKKYEPDYSSKILKVFCISLLYISPRAFSYVQSILKTLPPKELVLEWVRSGQISTLFPPGVKLKENKLLVDK